MGSSSYRHDLARRLRVGLTILAVPTLITGVWAVFAPASWYADYTNGVAPPRAFGAYNEHFIQDLGSGYLGIGVVLVLAAVLLNPAAITTAVAGFIAFTIPHLVIHVIEGGELDGTGYAVTTGFLGAGLAIAAWVSVLNRRRGDARSEISSTRS